MSPHDARRLLGDELWALVGSLDSPLLDIHVLTRLPSPVSRRASFRLRLADGQILKGRRCETADEAERVEYLWQFLDPGRFPRSLSRRGAALLIEWIEGQSLSASQLSPELLRWCGACQGSLHSTPLPREAHERYRSSPHAWQARLQRNARELVESCVLERGEATQALELAAAHAPGSVVVGLVHADYCAENMVVHPSGGVYHVDNEWISIDACEYDLARTWYRWPMTPMQRRAYYDGYSQHRSLGEFTKHHLYWALVVLLQSARSRLLAGDRNLWIPVSRLQALLRDQSNGAISLDRERFAGESVMTDPRANE